MSTLTHKLAQYETHHALAGQRFWHISGIISLWLGIGMYLWLVPPPTSNLRAGFATVIVMFVVYFHYHKLSRPLAWSSALLFIPIGFGVYMAHMLLSATAFANTAGTLCVLGLGQHIYSGWRGGYVFSRFWWEETRLAPAWMLQRLIAILQARKTR